MNSRAKVKKVFGPHDTPVITTIHCVEDINDPVNHPSHYTSGRIEVIDFIEDKELGFHLGNVVKYVARAGKKASTGKSQKEKTIEDLEKAAWYLNRYINVLRDGGDKE